MRKLLGLIILVAILSTLFVSSGQTYAEQSLVLSLEKWLPGKPIEGLLSKLEIPYWGTTVSIDERGYYYFVEFLLRKSAHFFIFGFLAVSVYLVLPKLWLRTLITLFITLLFAIADEYHQSLTGGRTPSLQDVLLDMSGAIVFLVIARFIFSYKKRKKSANVNS